jgi:predicted NBD/HSP70 family sugar kinase
MNPDSSPQPCIPEQIAQYQGDLLLTQPVCRFDPVEAATRLEQPARVLALDIGGDKLRVAEYDIGAGGLGRGSERVFRSKGGSGYLSLLEEIADEAASRDLRVGISSATKLAGSVITRTVNLPVFFAELAERCGADYERLFPRRSFVANDTITGICGASTRLALRGEDTSEVIFIICASGMGGSVIAGGEAIHVEVGHVPLADALNPLGQATPCGVEGRTFVCVERVTAARAGIEDVWRQQTGRAQDGVALGTLYEAGHPLATLLYETSARALAHAIAGTFARYGFTDGRRRIAVLHGGNFEIARYREAVRRYLDGIPDAASRLVFSRDLSTNVCLDGAAILATLDPARV